MSSDSHLWLGLLTPPGPELPLPLLRLCAVSSRPAQLFLQTGHLGQEWDRGFLKVAQTDLMELLKTQI